MGLHPTGLFRHLSARLTVVLHDPSGVDDSELDALRAGGVDIVDGRASRIVTSADGHVAAVELLLAVFNARTDTGSGTSAVVCAP